MKTHRFAIAFVLSSTLALAACQGSEQNSRTDEAPPASEHVAVPASSPVAPQAPVSAPVEIRFSATPVGDGHCEGAEPVIATVAWQVLDVAVNEVKVEVAAPGLDTRSLLSIGGRQGEVNTDRWVVGGTKFFLTDAASGRELASTEVPVQQCQ